MRNRRYCRLDICLRRTVFGVLRFLVLAASCSALDHSRTQASAPVSGVILLTGPGGLYWFNFTSAKEACLAHNLSMATGAQLETALAAGLETCSFGWLAENVAAIPRRSSVSTCGSGSVGVVKWRAASQRKFAAWCFNDTVSTVLVAISVISVILSTVGALCYYKMSECCIWTRAPPSDHEETWEQTSAELELELELQKRFTISSETALYALDPTTQSQQE
uniref:Link domain-containing protein n=1 Tax=Knipowitschia caucasica TaxID=637954 RepID=A0AAV2L505_KNICA